MTDKEKIRVEIVQKTKYYKELQDIKPVYECVLLNLEEIIDFIDSLPDEPKTDDLEEEIERIWKHTKIVNPYAYDKGEEMQIDKRELTNLARHFAEWGAEHVRNKSMTQEDKNMLRKVKIAITNSRSYEDDENREIIEWVKSLLKSYDTGT